MAKHTLHDIYIYLQKKNRHGKYLSVFIYCYYRTFFVMQERKREREREITIFMTWQLFTKNTKFLLSLSSCWLLVFFVGDNNNNNKRVQKTIKSFFCPVLKKIKTKQKSIIYKNPSPSIVTHSHAEFWGRECVRLWCFFSFVVEFVSLFSQIKNSQLFNLKFKMS
jgi:hypothetical protein